METIITFVIVAGIIWGGFATLLTIAIKKEKEKQ